MPDKFVPQWFDVETVARTAWAEARGEGVSGMEAVASVIMNRVALAREARFAKQFGATPAEVCFKPYQFSCWNPGDPNRALALTIHNPNPLFIECLSLAIRAVHGLLRDRTLGATHYHTDQIKPPWSLQLHFTIRIGRHLFYREGPPPDEIVGYPQPSEGA